MKDKFESTTAHLQPWKYKHGESTRKQILEICKQYDIDPDLIDFNGQSEEVTNLQLGASVLGSALTVGLLDIGTFALSENKSEKEQKAETQLLHSGSVLAAPQLKHFPLRTGFDLNSAQDFTCDLAKRHFGFCLMAMIKDR